MRKLRLFKRREIRRQKVIRQLKLTNLLIFYLANIRNYVLWSFEGLCVFREVARGIAPLPFS